MLSSGGELVTLELAFIFGISGDLTTFLFPLCKSLACHYLRDSHLFVHVIGALSMRFSGLILIITSLMMFILHGVSLSDYTNKVIHRESDL